MKLEQLQWRKVCALTCELSPRTSSKVFEGTQKDAATATMAYFWSLFSPKLEIIHSICMLKQSEFVGACFDAWTAIQFYAGQLNIHFILSCESRQGLLLSDDMQVCIVMTYTVMRWYVSDSHSDVAVCMNAYTVIYTVMISMLNILTQLNAQMLKWLNNKILSAMMS